MALSMLRQGVQVGRVIVSTVRLVPAAVSVNKRRTIVSKQFRKPNPDKPRPWPYETVKFTIWDALTEDTQDRFDENSRLIIIDGNIGVGKSTLAKKLAEELDFFLFPEATLDFKFIDDDGFDMRSLNHMFPDTAAPYDIERFYKNPKHVMAANFQYSMLALRYEQYLDAMAHLLSTGQGVILERCPYSDFVFAKAMHKAGYMDDYDMEIYNKMQRNIRVELFKPHIVIYLDAPIDVLKQRIKDRGLPYEQNTSVLTDDYLIEIDRCYKEEYLPSIKDDVEVVCYDWSTIGDAHRVVEDLERLPIEDIMNDPYHRKFEQWKGNTPRWWDHFRMRFTNEKNILLVHNLYSVPRLNHPCLVIPSDDIQEYNQICEKYVPPYTMGFNEKDSSHFLRMDANYRLRQRQEFYRTR